MSSRKQPARRKPWKVKDSHHPGRPIKAPGALADFHRRHNLSETFLADVTSCHPVTARRWVLGGRIAPVFRGLIRLLVLQKYPDFPVEVLVR